MNEKWEVTTSTIEIGRIIRNFYQQLYAKKLSILEEMEAFLETYKLPRLKPEEIDFFNSPINCEEIDFLNRPINYEENESGTKKTFQK